MISDPVITKQAKDAVWEQYLTDTADDTWGFQLKQALMDRKITQGDFARRCDTSLSEISRVLNGHIRPSMRVWHQGRFQMGLKPVDHPISGMWYPNGDGAWCEGCADG